MDDLKPPQSNNYSHLEKLLSLTPDTECTRTVSVIIPFHKRRDILEKSLCGLSQQTYPPHRCEVIIGDESEEGVEDLIRRFSTYLNIRSIKQVHKGFRIATLLNQLILAARNEIIVQLDFDMIPLPTHLEKHIRWFSLPARVATIGLRRFIDTADISQKEIMEDISLLEGCPNIRSQSNTGGGTADKRMPEFQFMKQHPFPGNCFHGCNVAYAKTDAIRLGLYDEGFNYSFGYEDIDFGSRISRGGVFLVYEPDATAFHQENEVVSLPEKTKGRERNRQLLYLKVPGIAQYRAFLSTRRLRHGESIPWREAARTQTSRPPC